MENQITYTYKEVKKSRVHRPLLCSTCTDSQNPKPRPPSSLICGSCRNTDTRCDGSRPCGPCIVLGPDEQSTCMPIVRERMITACDRCRTAKKKCNSIRPICDRCTRSSKACSWNGQSKSSCRPRERVGTGDEALGGASRSDHGGTELSLDDVPANTNNETARRRQEAPTGGSTGSLAMLQAASTQDREQSEGKQSEVWQSEGQQSYGELSDRVSVREGQDPAGILNWGDPADFDTRYPI